MSPNPPAVCPVPFDGPPTSLSGLIERFFRRCVEDITRVNAPKQSKCSAGLRDSLARFGIQLQSVAPVNLEGCLVAQSNLVSQGGSKPQGQIAPTNSSEPDFPLWLCPGHIRPGQVTRFPTSPDLVYVDIDGQETIFFRNASNPCANRDQLCPNKASLGRLFDLPKSSKSQFSVYLHGCLTLAQQRRCGYLDLRLPPNSLKDRFRLDSIRQGVTCPGGKVLLDNALELFPTTSFSSSSAGSVSSTTSVSSISTTSPGGTTRPPATGTATATRGASSTSSQPPQSLTSTRITSSRTTPPLPVPSPPGAVVGAPENEVTATIPPSPPSSSNGLEEGSTEGIPPSSIAIIFLSIVAFLGMSIVAANFLRRRKKRAAANATAVRRDSAMSFSSAEAPTPPTLPPPLPSLQHLHLNRKGSSGSDNILSGVPVPGDQRITPVNLMRSIPSSSFAAGVSGTHNANSASMTLGRHSVKGGGFERVDGVEYIHISSLVTADEIARAPDEPLQHIVDNFESIFMQLEAHVRFEVAADPSSPASSDMRTSHALETVQILRDKRAQRLITATSSLLAKATGRPVVPGSIPDGLGAKFLDVLLAMAKYDKESLLFTIEKDERLSDHTRTARVYHIMADVPRPTVVAATVMPGWMRSDGEVVVAVRVAAAASGDG